MKKSIKLSKPQLICVEKPHKGCNDGYYIVKIPYDFTLKGHHFIGIYLEYSFIGLLGKWK